MRIHAEGRRMLSLLLLLLLVINWALWHLYPEWTTISLVVSGLIFLSILQFFRDPNRPIPTEGDHLVYAPADGKVVVIEETKETEYFKDRRLQVSIFMSPANVHVNRTPISGRVKYVKYHPGRYLVAWHPKSSSENERTTVVIENDNMEILLRQIAGAMAKRIKNYLEIDQEVQQGDEIGFIKFGSRVDVFLPLHAKMKVSIGQKVKGNKTVLAVI